MPRGARATRFQVGREDFAVLVLPAARPPDLDALTAAEREVAGLVVRGFSNEEVAAWRASSERTVANQLQSIYRKLGVFSRLELARRLSGPD